MALIIGLDLTIALRLAAKGPAAVQIGVVIDLEERFEGHTEPLAVAENASMVIGNSPRPGIDVQVFVEPTLLGESTEFRVAAAAAQAPIAPAGTIVVFQHLHLIARVAQFIGGAHPGNARSEDQYGGALGCALQINGTSKRGVRRKPEAAHRLVHGGTSGGDAYHAQQIASTRRRHYRIFFHPY